MALYNVGFQLTFAPVIGKPVLEIKTGPTDYATVLEINFTNITSASGGSTSYGIGSASSQGTAFQEWPFVAEDPNSPACGVTLAGSWTTLPGAPSKYFRRFSQDSVSFFETNIIRLGSGIKLAPSTSLVMWTIAGNLVPYTVFGWVRIDG